MPEALSHLLKEIDELKNLINDQSRTSEKEEEEYLTPSEMAQALKISMVTLWHWDKKGITHPLRVGNLKRYRKSDLKKMMIEFGKSNPVK